MWASKCCPVGCKCTQPHAAALNFLASRSQPRHVDMLHLATWLRHLSSFYSGITSKLTSQKLWQPCGPSTLRRAWCLFRGFGKSGRFSLGSCEALRLHCHWIWPPLKMWWPCCGFIWDCFALSMNENVELQISLSLCIQVLYQKHENIRSSWIWMEALWYLDIRLLHRSTARRRCRQEA